ncbi:unnamed protein product [Moneuplotes crassus]|uniref:Uncharacterized protein n=1 Tax=Euplotes crassus TaxID=5936 RepID=A0AAD2CZW3_EUPCR|nr:unnamed protein product [Moneuplotes crassus]
MEDPAPVKSTDLLQNAYIDQVKNQKIPKYVPKGKTKKKVNKITKKSLKMGQSQSVASLTASSFHSNNGRSVLLPPLRKSINLENKKVIITKRKKPIQRFEEPSSIREMKESVPSSYQKDFTSFLKSINASQSNLGKASRWKRRSLNEQDLECLPSPSSYNLEQFKSIATQAKASNADHLRKKRNSNMRYGRFGGKTYFKELDVSNCEQGPGPGVYDSHNYKQIKLPKMKHKKGFSYVDRKLEFKKEKKESPSPTKYNVQYEFKGTNHVKGPTFGSAEKKFSMF